MPEIVVVPPDPTWPEGFRAVGRALRQALGPPLDGRLLAIHHIGSTAVPGLPAKPVLDVQLTVGALDAPLEAALDAALAPLGYVHRPAASRDHEPPGMTLPPVELAKRFYRGLDPRVNLHVRVAGRFNQRYPLLFRDYLRARPAAAAAYGETKRALAGHFPDDVDGYYAIKDPVCDVIMAAAADWAAAAGWSPGPSDA